jgi:hypothetical protein
MIHFHSEHSHAAMGRRDRVRPEPDSFSPGSVSFPHQPCPDCRNRATFAQSRFNRVKSRQIPVGCSVGALRRFRAGGSTAQSSALALSRTQSHHFILYPFLIPLLSRRLVSPEPLGDGGSEAKAGQSLSNHFPSSDVGQAFPPTLLYIVCHFSECTTNGVLLLRWAPPQTANPSRSIGTIRNPQWQLVPPNTT